jgi:hypothetical protein
MDFAQACDLVMQSASVAIVSVSTSMKQANLATWIEPTPTLTMSLGGPNREVEDWAECVEHRERGVGQKPGQQGQRRGEEEERRRREEEHRRQDERHRREEAERRRQREQNRPSEQSPRSFGAGQRPRPQNAEQIAEPWRELLQRPWGRGLPPIVVISPGEPTNDERQCSINGEKLTKSIRQWLDQVSRSRADRFRTSYDLYRPTSTFQGGPCIQSYSGFIDYLPGMKHTGGGPAVPPVTNSWGGPPTVISWSTPQNGAPTIITVSQQPQQVPSPRLTSYP